MDSQLHDLLDAAVGEPPHRVSVDAVRRRVAMRRVMECTAAAAAVAVIAVIAVIVPAGTGALGHTSPPSAGGSAVVPTIYVSSDRPGIGTVIPITVATNTPGKPINAGRGPVGIVITPDGKTAYVANQNSGTVTPITVATNAPGKPINVGSVAAGIAITPDGKTAYVVAMFPGTITPVATATNMPGKPINAGPRISAIAITP